MNGQPKAAVFADLDKFLGETDQPLLVIIGPTAGGKTALAIDIAQKLGNAEIINADSRQLYRYLDIGTAKASDEERAAVPHHMLDVLDPRDDVSIGWYQDQVRPLIAALQKAGRIPMLVGGSMLYVSSIIDELALAPAGDPAIRERLSDEYDADAGAALFKRLQETDPEAADNIDQRNKPYLIRALEIMELTEQKRSDVFEKMQLRQGANSDTFIIGLAWPREVLHERINKRTKKLLDDGFIREVQELLNKGYKASDPGLKSHGYPQVIQHLETGEPNLEQLEEQIAAKTRQYARRQETWWRTDTRIHWIDAQTL